MLKIKNNIFIVCITVFIIVSILFLSGFSNKNDTSIPRAEKGFIDLSDNNYYINGTLLLSGEWELYDKKLLTPEDFNKELLDVVPEYFDVNEKNKFFKIDGYSTYRLKVKLNKNIHIYSLDFKYSSLESYKLWVDGKLISSFGNVKQEIFDKPVHRDVLLRKIENFVSNNDTVEIVFQVSSSKIKEKIQPFYLTIPKYVLDRKDSKMVEAFFIYGFMTFLGLYHVLLYFFRREDKQKLYLGLTCIFASMVSMFGNARIGESYSNIESAFAYFLTVQIRPGYPYFFIIFHNAIAVIGVMLFAISTNYFFESRVSIAAKRVYYFVIISYIFFAITGVIDFNSIGFYFYLLNLLGLFLLVVYPIYLSVKALLLQKNIENLLVSIGVLVCCSIEIHDVLLYSDIKIITSLPLISYGVTFLYLCQSAIVARRFVQLFYDTQIISNELKDTLSKLKVLINNSKDISSVTDDGVKELVEMIEQITNSNKQIADAIEKVSEGAIVQTEKAAEGIKVGEMLDNDFQELISIADNMRHAARTLIKSGEEGIQQVSSLREIQEKNYKAISEVNGEVINLIERVNKISIISNTILAISKEIKLLALNTAIEAVKTNENERGFSVIAKNIKKLAMQTNIKAKEIQEMLNEILKTSRKTFEVINYTNEATNEQNRIVSETVDKFRAISSTIKVSIEHINEMYDKISKLGMVNETVKTSMSEITEVTESNCAVTEEVSAIVQEQLCNMQKINSFSVKLKGESEKLKELIYSLNIEKE